MNDNLPDLVSMTRDQASALLAAGNLLTDMWGDLAGGVPMTLGDINGRMAEAGLTMSVDGAEVISDVLLDAVVDVGAMIAASDESGDIEDVAPT